MDQANKYQRVQYFIFMMKVQIGKTIYVPTTILHECVIFLYIYSFDYYYFL